MSEVPLYSRAASDRSFAPKNRGGGVCTGLMGTSLIRPTPPPRTLPFFFFFTMTLPQGFRGVLGGGAFSHGRCTPVEKTLSSS